MRTLIIAAVCAIVWLQPSAHAQESRRTKNVILITLDGLRWQEDPEHRIKQSAQPVNGHEQHEPGPDQGWVEPEVRGDPAGDTGNEAVVTRTG